MKIGFYINVLGGGGAERVIANLANEFSSEHDCFVVTTNTIENEYAILDRVKHYDLGITREGSFLKRNVKIISGLRKILKKEKPDILISFMAEPNFRAIMATRLLGIKTLVSVRNDPNREYGSRLFRFLAKLLYRKADGIVFQTEDAKNWFPKAIQKKSEIIYNQVAEKFYETSASNDAKDIVTTGRLTAQKNHRLLIDAFAMIADKVEDNLIIYGKGELEDELRAHISELGLKNRIFLPGPVSDVPSVLSGAKIFVMSSNYEGMPNSLMEAMAVGLPCISTDCPCGGPRELIANEKSGILFPVGDKDALANAMLRLLSDNELRKNLAASVKASADRFLPERVFERWRSYVDSIVTKK